MVGFGAMIEIARQELPSNDVEEENEHLRCPEDWWRRRPQALQTQENRPKEVDLPAGISLQLASNSNANTDSPFTVFTRRLTLESRILASIKQSLFCNLERRDIYRGCPST